MKHKDFLLWLNYFIQKKESFEVIVSKNTAIIKYYSEEKGKFLKQSFSEKSVNFSVFHIVRELKKECELWLLNNERFHDVRERAFIRYYNYAANLPEKIDAFYFVDISSAYLTALFLNNIISKYIFDKINNLEKKDRLICLGMLAYEPFIISYVDGEKGETTKQRNYYSPVFYTACSIIENIMDDLIKLISDQDELLPIHSFDRSQNYLFYWVDGLFFKEKKHAQLITDYLNNAGYSFRIGNCFLWKLERKINHFNIEFSQDDKGKIEKKVYNIPYHFQNIKDREINLKLVQKGNFSELFDKFKEQKYGAIYGTG